MFIATNPYRSKDDWILNLGCTYHMSTNRNWFYAYRSIEGGVVLMDNDSQSKAIRIGTVELRMHDRMTVTLTEVWHVRDLTKNLISLSTLEAKCCKYLAKDGVLTSRMAILSCRQGDQEISTSCKEVQLIGAAADTTVLSSETDRTKLWHLRMGHMSEKGMTILSRGGLNY